MCLYRMCNLFLFALDLFNSTIVFDRMIQSAFVDMESMFDLLTEEKEVSPLKIDVLSQLVYTENIFCLI